MMSNNSPCYKCKSRTVGCHEKCDKYLAWAESRKKVLKSLDKNDSWTHAKGNKVVNSTSKYSDLKGCGV